MEVNEKNRHNLELFITNVIFWHTDGMLQNMMKVFSFLTPREEKNR